MPPEKVDDLYKKYDCLCPFCRNFHEVELYWTGHLPPRIYCKPCKAVISGTLNAIGTTSIGRIITSGQGKYSE